MDDAVYDAVIVGGGAAGLASAWALRHNNILLLEEHSLGGRMKSVPRGEYWLNLGAHLFPGAGSAISELIQGLGLEVIEIPGSKTGMFFEGKVRIEKRIEAYPLTLPLSVRERVAFALTGLRLLALVKRWQRITRRRSGESDYERVTRVASRENDRSFRDFIGKVPPRVAQIFETAGRRASCELEEQSTAVGAALFASHWSGKKDSTALNLLGGSGMIGDAMLRALGSQVRLGAHVDDVREDGDRVTVAYSDVSGSHSVSARHVVVAVPPPTARNIVADIRPELDAALAAVKYGQFLVMSMLTTESGPMPWDDVYALATPGLSFSMFFNHANPIRRAGERRPGGSLMCYAGGLSARRAMPLADAEIECLFKDDLYKMYPQLRGIIGETVIQRWPVAGQYREPGDRTFGDLLRYANHDGSRIHYAGDYFAPLGQIEVAASSGAAAAASILSRLRGGANNETGQFAS